MIRNVDEGRSGEEWELDSKILNVYVLLVLRSALKKTENDSNKKGNDKFSSLYI